MNHREEPHLPGGRRQAFCLMLLLVPALGLEQGHAGPRHGSLFPRCAEPTPYLPVLGSPALRLAEIPPPPDLATKPAAGAPPVPQPTPASAGPPAPVVAAARAASSAKPDATAPAASPAADASNPPPASTPSPILPDTARPAIHAEDFLPYFQVPGAAQQSGDVTLMPSPATPPPLPASAATYTQTPQ